MLVRRVRHISVPSDYVREKILRRFQLTGDRVTVVPGGVDTNRFYPSAPLLCNVPKRYILFVGSVQPRKNLDKLLQAWREIQNYFPDVWLLAAGGTSGIFKQVDILKNQERFLWLGYIAEDDLPGLYAHAEVFVLPSLDEGFGLPVLEAMACGTSVITARSGAIPEVAGEAALFFNPSRGEELAETLKYSLQNPDLRRSMAGKGLAHVQMFPWAYSARKLMEVLQQCQ
jgi:glycosyltransferase involved in cell wall biosynthesis